MDRRRRTWTSMLLSRLLSLANTHTHTLTQIRTYTSPNYMLLFQSNYKEFPCPSHQKHLAGPRRKTAQVEGKSPWVWSRGHTTTCWRRLAFQVVWYHAYSFDWFKTWMWQQCNTEFNLYVVGSRCSGYRPQHWQVCGRSASGEGQETYPKVSS